MTLAWKPDWEETKSAMLGWWNGTGMALCLTADNPAPRPPLPMPSRPADLLTSWIDPVYHAEREEAFISRQHFLGDSFPIAENLIGPGSLSTFLGSRPDFAEDTVWYWPCIDDPDTYGAIRFSPQNNYWLDIHLAMIDETVRRSAGRYLVAMPDLIENLDVLASLRGDEKLLFDLIERPSWVSERLGELNTAYFQAYDLIYERIKQVDEGSVFAAFRVWGPGKTAKVQCDISASISPRMFRRFVVPHLAEQVRWLDYSLYHLDGTTCMQHLDALLEIDGLNAIEWTPQAGRPGGGSSSWFDLYKRIKSGGKGIQAIGVEDEEVIPLLDAVGPAGTYILLSDRPRSVDQAESLLKAVEPYRK